MVSSKDNFTEHRNVILRHGHLRTVWLYYVVEAFDWLNTFGCTELHSVFHTEHLHVNVIIL